MPAVLGDVVGRDTHVDADLAEHAHRSARRSRPLPRPRCPDCRGIPRRLRRRGGGSQPRVLRADEDAAALGARDDLILGRLAQHLQVGAGEHHAAALARATRAAEPRPRCARRAGRRARGDRPGTAPATAARSRVAASNAAVASATMRLASALSSAPSALVSRDQRLLLGDGRVGLLESLHDLELAVFEVALAARERGELALEPLRLLRSCCWTARRSASRALRASTTATSDSMRDELGAQVVAGAEARRQLLRERLAAGEQLLHAAPPAAGSCGRGRPGGCGRRARRPRRGGAGLRGWHSRVQPTPARRRRNGRPLAFNDRPS